MNMTHKQKELARHALGLPNKKNASNRNHYCVGAGCEDYCDWESMVTAGNAVKVSGANQWIGDFFYLTLQGAKQALESRVYISQEDAAKMRERSL